MHGRLGAAAAALGLVAACSSGGDRAEVRPPGASGDPGATTVPAAGPSLTDTGVPGAVIDPGDGGHYAPSIEPAEFSAVVDNPWFPLRPGERWVYESTSGEGDQRITVEVLAEPRTVMGGVPVVQVHDTATEGATTVEDTIDLYSQRADGSVWYFGEATTAYDHGRADSEGSWEAGVDGALPGVIMPAAPAAGRRGYRQEYYPGHAEDMGMVVGTTGTADLPAGHFEDLVVTVDWSPLEPDVVEEKSYAKGIGVIQEATTSGNDEVVRLIHHDPGG